MSLPMFLSSVRSFALARVLISAVELDLFPLLHAEALTRDDLKRALGVVDTDLADAFLDILIAFEVLREEDGLLRLTPLGESVLPNYASIRGWTDEMLMFFRSLLDLTDTLRSGQFEDTELARYWSYKQGADRAQLDAKQVAGYSRAMDESQKQLARIIAQQHDFSRYDHVIDFGGGYGQLAMTLAEQYQHLRITVADLPAVCHEARARLDRLGLGGRVEILPVDFLVDDLPEHAADALLFVRVLHDWSDDRACEILRRTRRCLRPAGDAIIVEPILAARDHPDRASAQTSLMLALMGGRRRSVHEYAELLEAAGYTLSSWRHAGLSIYKLLVAQLDEASAA